MCIRDRVTVGGVEGVNGFRVFRRIRFVGVFRRKGKNSHIFELLAAVLLVGALVKQVK